MKCMDKQVLLFVISLAKCLAMSIDELQDFSNFLKETSLLDQPLKKNPSDEEDDDVPISDHAWEESGRFEGDLILNDRQRQLIVQDIAEGLSRNGLKDSTKRWPDNEVIFYIQKEHFSDDQIQAILRGIEDLSQASCVKFRPYRKGDRDAVVVQGSRRGCFSQVGYQGGYQVLNLSGRHPVGRGCFRHGTVVHEFLHTLGFYHMQSSPDRDDYIDVVWENIVQPARHNFRKYNLFSVSDFGVGYDYDSVLHYSRKAFSSNGGDTLVPKKSGVDIGQRLGLSDKDTAKLNKMYCDADSNNFEAADDVPHTPVKKKKTPKNKPFEGHGIGYHQGKTVVFKLPATETYRVPETPANHVFDYFSKAPEAMSPTLIEGFGAGKKIAYSYNLPAGYQFVEHNIPMYTSLFNKTNQGVETILRKDNTQKKNDDIKPFILDPGNKNKETIEDFDEKAITVDKSIKTPTAGINIHKDIYKPNTDYSEFYNPISNYKIGTKTDYYLNYSPHSQGNNDQPAIKEANLKKPFNLDPANKSKEIIEDFAEKGITVDKSIKTPTAGINIHKDIYKPNTDYSKFYNPVNNNKFGTITDYYLNYSPPSLGNNDQPAIKETNFKLTRQFIEKLREPKPRDYSTDSNKEAKFLHNESGNNSETLEKPKIPTKEESTLGDEDVSFRKVYPYTKLEDIKNIYTLTPEYFSKKYLENRHNFRKFYNPSDYLNSDHRQIIKNGQYTLFGDPVPIKIDYVSKINSESTENIDTHSRNKNVNDKIKTHEDGAEKHYSYEEYEPYDSAEGNNSPSSVSNEENPKTYEVTEKNEDRIAIVTEKSNLESSASDEVKHRLEKRLPDILERYVSYDNYDITSPYVPLKLDEGRSYSRIS